MHENFFLIVAFFGMFGKNIVFLKLSSSKFLLPVKICFNHIQPVELIAILFFKPSFL